VALEIVVGGWEHDCCGSDIARGVRVEWTYLSHTDGRLYETHHDLEGVDALKVTGAVVDIELVQGDGSRVAITRIPGGRALRGFDARDDGEIKALHSEEILDASTAEFVVTLGTTR
jgi:hypothetical protein